MIDGVRCVIGAETFFCASISTAGSVGARSAGFACGAAGKEGAFSCATGVTTRGRTALLLSCAFISTAAKRRATTNRARRVRVFICFISGRVTGLKPRRVEGRQRGVRFAHAVWSCQPVFTHKEAQKHKTKNHSCFLCLFVA